MQFGVDKQFQYFSLKINLLPYFENYYEAAIWLSCFIYYKLQFNHCMAPSVPQVKSTLSSPF